MSGAKLRSVALRLVKSGLRVYLLVLLVLVLGQRCMIYPKPSVMDLPASSRGQLVTIRHTDQRPVYAYHVKARDDAPTVVIFHGNAEQLADQVSLAEDFADVGLGVYAVEYPGYGPASAGTTTEQNVYADAEIALHYLESELHVARSRMVLFGRSLGTGVAVEMAVRGFGGRLILLSPYTSMWELAGETVTFIPARWLVLDRYDTLAKAGLIQQPSLIIHGAKDRVVPCDMGVRVSKRLRNSTLHVIPAADHNDLLDVGGPESWGSIIAFANTRP